MSTVFTMTSMLMRRRWTYPNGEKFPYIILQFPHMFWILSKVEMDIMHLLPKLYLKNNKCILKMLLT